MTKTYILSILLFLGVALCNAQTTVRGMYVSDIDNWLGDTTFETDLLSYAKGNGYTYMVFYDLGSLSFSNTSTKNKLASFILRAKTLYGISEIGAAGEVASFFSNDIIPYNNSRSNSDEKFNVLNFEFEFWVNSSISASYCSRYLLPNGYGCDTSGAFAFGKQQFQLIKNLAANNGIICEMYLGWPNRGQIRDIATIADRILLHAYRPNDNDVYQYSKNRLVDIASLNRPTDIVPIFSSEPAFMGPWLASHLITEPFQTYNADYNADINSWKQYIKLKGYTWFTYEYMPKTIILPIDTCEPPVEPIITFSGSTVLLPGQYVTLIAPTSPGYLWSNGMTTQTISVTAGTYWVRAYSGPNCFSTSNAVTFTELITNGTTFEIFDKTIKMYPNPATTWLNIQSEISGAIVISDIYGNKVNSELDNNYLNIDISKLRNGLLIVHIITINGIHTNKILKQ